MTTFLLIIGALALSLALVWIFDRPSAGAVAAYFGTWAMARSGYSFIDSDTLLFWAVAVLIVTGIQMARGRVVTFPLKLRCYVAGGSLALAATGALFGPAGVIIGAVAGVALGAVACRAANRAFSNNSRYWASVLALGAPVVVAVCLVMLAVTGIIARANIMQ